MKITDILDAECILPDLTSTSKKDLMVEMVGIMKSLNRVSDADSVVNVLLEREALGSTGIGYGVAIPHTKTDDVDTLVCMFGRSQAGIDFDSLDGAPVHLLFLLLTPKNSSGEHLKALARISSLLKDKLFRQELLEAKDREHIFNLIKREDDKKGE